MTDEEVMKWVEEHEGRGDQSTTYEGKKYLEARAKKAKKETREKEERLTPEMGLLKCQPIGRTKIPICGLCRIPCLQRMMMTQY